jgi:hypothetical protein
MTQEHPATPNSLVALHQRQLAWKPLPRVLWWVVLLPIATACWAASQARAPKQAAGWALAGLALLGYVSLAVGAASPKATTRSSSGAGAAVLTAPTSAPAVTPTATATPEPTPTTEVVTAAPTTEAPAPVAPTPAPAAPVSPRSVPTHVQAAAPPAVPVGPAAPVAPAAPAAQSFANCDALNAVYPHGVGRPGAVDHVSGSSAPVTDFQVDAAVYAANTGRDRDGDGIACETH